MHFGVNEELKRKKKRNKCIKPRSSKTEVTDKCDSHQQSVATRYSENLKGFSSYFYKFSRVAYLISNLIISKVAKLY